MNEQQIRAALAAREQAARRRHRRILDSAQGVSVVLDGTPLTAFASNDYLGLADHPQLVEAARAATARFGVGAGASHLLGGHHRLHEEAEAKLAAFTGRASALLFGSGYLANLGVVTALVGRGDAVFADKLNHASLNEACLLSRARFRRFRHHDLAHLEQLLQTTPAASRLIAVDGVFSMDGDQADIPALLALAHRYDAWLYVDDAHGFGVLGGGRGSCAGLSDPRLILMATLGKAAGVSGAFVAADTFIIEWLINAAKSYIYTTGTPPAQAAAVMASVDVMQAEPWRAARVLALARRFAACRAELPGVQPVSHTPIQPVVLGADALAVSVSDHLRRHGFWVPPVRPPTVPEGSARLRVSLSARHSDDMVETLTGMIKQVMI